MHEVSWVATAITSPLSYLLEWLDMCFAMSERFITSRNCATG